VSGDEWYEVGGKRYTMLLLDHTHVVSRLAREGRLPILVNLCGYESTGDAQGR